MSVLPIQRAVFLSFYISSFFDKLPDSGQDKNTVDSTCKNPKRNRDNDQEEDELLQNLSFRKRVGPPFIKKTRKNFTGPPVRCFQERKN